MLSFEKYKTIIFDCDGVILDSNHIKSDAFEKALKGEDSVLINEFINYHKLNGGVSRFIKFEYFYKVLKESTDYKDELIDKLEKYARICNKGLLNCDEIPGILSFFKYLQGIDINLYVVSGGEQSEVRNVLTERGISVYFEEVYGSPESKTRHLQKINTEHALYFGDSYVDYMVAKEFDVEFIFISGASEWSDGIEFCNNNNIQVFKDFNEIINSYKYITLDINKRNL